MSKKGISRNDPCPCGSGKKYKKCCYQEEMSAGHKNSEKTNLILPPYKNIDYGKPLINELFFQMNKVHEISAPRLVYSNLLNPEIEALATKFSNQFINRGKEEALIISNTENIDQLIDITKNNPDLLNYVLLKNRLLEYKSVTVPLILEELKKPQKDSFFEIAARVIRAAEKDYSNEIIEVIMFYQKDAYAVSLLCMLLGFYDNNQSEKLLWDYFNYFKKKWPDDTLSDGPLLGLEEIRFRREKKLDENYSNKTLH